jgi:hypothetical protein
LCTLGDEGVARLVGVASLGDMDVARLGDVAPPAPPGASAIAATSELAAMSMTIALAVPLALILARPFRIAISSQS